jgi:hypothetical protein
MILKYKGQFDFEILRQELGKSLGFNNWHLNAIGDELSFVSNIDFPMLLQAEVSADPDATPPIEGSPAVYGPDPDVIINTHFANGKLRSQNAVWEKIKAKRDEIKSGGFKVGTYWFHSDPDSRTQQLGLVLLGTNIPANLQWKTMTGEFVTMTPDLAQQIFQAAAASDIAIFAKAEEHRSSMLLANDPNTYDFSTGWPEVYVTQ